MDLHSDALCEELENGVLFLQEIQTPHGVISRIWLSRGCIYAILGEGVNAKVFYPYIREKLGAVKIYVYVRGLGLYDPFSGTYKPADGETALQMDIDRCLRLWPPQYTQTALFRIRDRLIDLHARTTGYHRENDGTLYILHNGVFQKASDYDPEHIFPLCLYGGVLGLHRFAMGRWLSGLIYALTCGFFLAGWLIDLLQLFCGIQRDKYKCLLLPLQDRKQKLKKLPIGLLLGAAGAFCYASLFSMLSGASDVFGNALLKLISCFGFAPL